MDDNSRLSLIMVEDNPELSDTVQAFLQREKAIRVLGVANAEKGFRDLIAKHVPDLALIDIGLDTPRSGLDLLEWLRRDFPVVKPVIMTVNQGDVMEAYRLGARGYVLKTHLEILTKTLLEVSEGKLIIPPDVGELLLKQTMEESLRFQKSLEFQQFSEREREILLLLRTETPRETIAERLCISFFTVRRHIQNILEKTGESSIKAVMERFGEVLDGREPSRG